MNVPIHSADMIKDGGFSKSVKLIKKFWPDSQGIKLSQAREILSQGLGYRDHHDLNKHLSSSCLTMDCPPLHVIKKSIVAAALTHLSAIERNEAAVAVLIDRLPLNKLSALKTTDDKASSKGLPASQDHQDDETEGMSDSPDTNSSNLPSKARTAPQRTTASPKPLSRSEMRALARAAAISGDIGDQALFLCLLTGVRPVHLLQARVSDMRPDGHLVLQLGDRKRPRLLHTRTNGTPPENTTMMVPMDRKRVKNLIKLKHYKYDSLLFPSPQNPNQPLNPHEFIKKLDSWSKAAGLNHRLLAHTIRFTIACHALSSVRNLTTNPPTALKHVNLESNKRSSS
ncbi:hypothetical protein [Pseudomonas donghuensis]|uniref:hypothetical protein n=1 Tax=Pseudomonas donghuensis TaxID=1163398 RepID=UPI0020C2F7A4|nr:hypothetical protein [Pseudomonas donghuensis]MCP6699369.1 hypothetical protein [Pseudomonas donghuensis]